MLNGFSKSAPTQRRGRVGLGGDDTWSLAARAHVKYRIPLTPRAFAFTLTPSSLARTQTGLWGGAD
jgi:beta-galactosidase